MAYFVIFPYLQSQSQPHPQQRDQFRHLHPQPPDDTLEATVFSLHSELVAIAFVSFGITLNLIVTGTYSVNVAKACPSDTVVLPFQLLLQHIVVTS